MTAKGARGAEVVGMDAVTYTIRAAAADDVEALCALDDIAQADERRRDFIRRTVAAGQCIVAVPAGAATAIGYAVLEYTFFELGFVSMLYMHPAWRGRGAGTALMRYCEAICRTDKLFTSTNLSNLPMQALLAKLGYSLCGVIHGLDEGDPELFYRKVLRVEVV